MLDIGARVSVFGLVGSDLALGAHEPRVQPCGLGRAAASSPCAVSAAPVPATSPKTWSNTARRISAWSLLDTRVARAHRYRACGVPGRATVTAAANRSD